MARSRSTTGRVQDTFVFASEIKGVLAHPAVPCQLDERALSAYLTFGYVPTPFTFYDGIRSLPPAHTLLLESGGQPRLERYWQLERPADGAVLNIGVEEAAAETGPTSNGPSAGA